MADNPFDEFEQEMSDVANPFDEMPGMAVDIAFVQHLEDLLGHFMGHVLPHVMMAREQGRNSVVYLGRGACTITVRVREHDIDIRFAIPPDLMGETL